MAILHRRFPWNQSVSITTITIRLRGFIRDLLTQYMLVLNALLICTFNLQRPSTRVGHVAAIHRLCFHATYMGKI